MNVLKRKLVSKIAGWWLCCGLLIVNGWQCASRLVTFTDIPTAPLMQRQQALQALMPLQGEGRISYDQGQLAVTLPFRFIFYNLDSLRLQLYDPLGRQLAQVTLNGNEYELFLQRENRLFSGSAMPALLKNYMPVALTTAAVRSLLVGLPFVLPDDRQSVKYRFGNFRTGLNSVVLPGQVTVRYRHFGRCGEVALAQEITCNWPDEQTTVMIQLTNFQPAQLKLRPNPNE